MKPFAQKPAPIDLTFDASAKIALVHRAALVAYPTRRDAGDLNALQSACQQSASRLAEDLGGQKFENFRSTHFLLALERYAADIPLESRDGNILLADDSADELRELAEEFATTLPDTFARRLNRLLTKHDELRGYYRDAADLDEAIRDTAPLPTPPAEPVAAIVKAIQEQASDAFTPEAREAIKQILRPPVIELGEGDIRRTTSPETQKKHSYKVFAVFARLAALITAKPVRDGIASSARSTSDQSREDLRLAAHQSYANLPHWPW